MAIQPRVCGDYLTITMGRENDNDTTPRVRGLLPPIDFLIVLMRYNPACAGTTQAPVSIKPVVTIQPRVCGDYVAVHLCRDVPSDTTPRVRGLPMS